MVEVAGGIIGGFFIGFLASLLANYFSPAFSRKVNRFFSCIFYLLDPDRFDLTGKWTQTFKEPSETDPNNWVEEEETVTITHLGNVISGEGCTTRFSRTFFYDLRVRHNMVVGHYNKKGEKGNVAGSGLCQMIVRPDRLEMKGQATWYDHDTEKIESSEIIWTKR